MNACMHTQAHTQTHMHACMHTCTCFTVTHYCLCGLHDLSSIIQDNNSKFYTVTWWVLIKGELWSCSVNLNITVHNTNLSFCEQVLFVYVSTLIPPCLTDQRNFTVYCTISNPGTGAADDAFVLKRGVWRNATWPSHSRPAIAASARLFQICFSPLTFWPLVCLSTLCLPSPFYAPSHE